MASLKEIKTRINSVKNTRKITSAMKMVASAKLHKAQGIMENMQPYQRKLNGIFANFLRANLPLSSPYIEERAVKRIAIVAFASSSSLCGAFNANAIRLLGQVVESYVELGEENILIFPVGKKMEEAARLMKGNLQEVPSQLAEKPIYADVAALAHRLMAMYAAGEVDHVELVYHHFKSVGVQQLCRQLYLPVNPEQLVTESIQTAGETQEYIVEPSVEQLLADLVPMVLTQKLFSTAIESYTSEHAARTLAMQVATDNANELIQELTKQYNKSRQQAITNELLDIVGGSL